LKLARKDIFEYLIDFLRTVKVILIPPATWAILAYRFVKSYFLLAFNFAETCFLGYWNALLVHKNHTAPDTVVIA